MKKLILFILFISLFFACKPKYRACNDLLSACTGSQNGRFCTFGYKWGEQPEFSPNGLEVVGPQLPGGVISFSFHTEIKKVSTHQRNNMTTINFDDKGICAREMTLNALKEWEQYGDFSFQQLEDNAISDIKFIAAKKVDNNTGNPNYPDELCSDISGNVVWDESAIENCHHFFIRNLHEIGHVLGLGHVNNESVMKQGLEKLEFTGLQNVDIEGIIAIYGEK